MVHPVIDTVLPFTEIRKAHEMMEANQNNGKIVLEVHEETKRGRKRVVESQASSSKKT